METQLQSHFSGLELGGGSYLIKHSLARLAELQRFLQNAIATFDKPKKPMDSMLTISSRSLPLKNHALYQQPMTIVEFEALEKTFSLDPISASAFRWHKDALMRKAAQAAAVVSSSSDGGGGASASSASSSSSSSSSFYPGWEALAQSDTVYVDPQKVIVLHGPPGSTLGLSNSAEANMRVGCVMGASSREKLCATAKGLLPVIACVSDHALFVDAMPIMKDDWKADGLKNICLGSRAMIVFSMCVLTLAG